jgi:PKD domain
VKLPSRPLQSAAALIASVLAALAFAVAPAGAIVTTVGSTNAGLQPRSTSLLLGGYEGIGPEAKTFANAGGSPIVASSKTYAIYWDPTDHYHGDWQNVINTFLNSMGADSGSLASVFAVDAQYTDAANHHALYKSTFMGAYTDTNAYPSSGNCVDPHPLTVKDRITCLTNLQLKTELETFISQHSLPKGMGTIFYILTPPGVTTCLDAGGATGHCSSYEESSLESYENSFCSYHADVSPTSPSTGDGNTILYAVIPWTAGGLADGHLQAADQTTAFDCQDGGFDPSSKPVIEKREKAKEKTAKENEEFAAKTPEEKAEQEHAELLSGPHQQEPNQVPCPSPDGFCDTGLADLIINQIGVEQQNIVTNPLLNAWQDGIGNEGTDECRDFFAPVLGGSVTANETTGAGTLYNQTLNSKNYYLNDAFNLAALKLPYPAINCISGIRLEPQFTAPNPVNTGEVVGFDGMESDISLDWGTTYSGGVAQPTFASYTWNFGDGTPTVTGFAPGASAVNSPGNTSCSVPWVTPCAASVFHSYQYGGTYEVTLTVTDTGGNTTSVTNQITVEGPPPPSPPSEPASGGSASGATGGSGTSPASGVTTKPVPPAPVASQAIVSRSLAKTIRGGLVARYSVNEQVTGHFEVLLAASIAHRLGLHGPLAAGLATGTPPQVIIAKALLVTTKAGSNTLKLQFGKITAKRLRRLHTVPLMLRLTVRNAGGGTTTVLSKITLR